MPDSSKETVPFAGEFNSDGKIENRFRQLIMAKLQCPKCLTIRGARVAGFDGGVNISADIVTTPNRRSLLG